MSFKRQLFVVLQYAGTLLTIDHFKDGFSWSFSFISHILLERLVSFLYHMVAITYIVYRISYISISYCCNNISWSLLLLFLNIFYLGLLMLKQNKCKLCPKFDTKLLEGMLTWLHGFGYYFSIISCCVNWKWWRCFLYMSS